MAVVQRKHPHAEIAAVRGQIILISPEDYDLVSRYRWYIDSGGYPRTSISRNEKLRLHNLLLPVQAGMTVDHRDGNKLNNTRDNLRYATYSVNSQGRKNIGVSSKYRGVHRNRYSFKWIAQITIAGKVQHLGSFEAEIDAAIAYDNAAIEHFGPLARTNFHDRS
jgi:hypothetical protein